MNVHSPSRYLNVPRAETERVLEQIAGRYLGRVVRVDVCHDDACPCRRTLNLDDCTCPFVDVIYAEVSGP